MVLNRIALLCAAVCAVIVKCYGHDIFVNDTTFCDTTNVSLFQSNWFVIRGEMSRAWNGTVRLAVTDPVRNHSYDLSATDGKHFQKTIPMRGAVQDIYLYVPGTMIIPVCAGDTIDLKLGDDDLELSSDNPGANLDLQLAIALYRKTRKQEYQMSDIMGKYFKESKFFTETNSRTDSLQRAMTEAGKNYQTRHTTVIDTFIANHGKPRLEKFYRLSGFYQMLDKYVMIDLPLTQLAPTWHLDSTHNNLSYNEYCDALLNIPSYRKFSTEYLKKVLRDRLEVKLSDISKTKESAFMLNGIRGLSPTPLFADRAILDYWDDIYRYSGPEMAALFVKQVYDACVTPEIAAEYHKVMHDVLRLSKGEPAPQLILTDGDGHSYTLDDFKGKYLYLDFWDMGCKPCLEEFAVIPQLKNLYGDKIDNVTFVTVCISRLSKRKLEKFAQKHGMSELNLILDSAKSDPCYDVTVLPTYMLIDPKGRIAQFNTARPSEIIRKFRSHTPTAFEKAINRVL